MTDNYQSPYGFGPVTDAVIDCIGDRKGILPNDMAELIDSMRLDGSLDTFDGFLWWEQHMGPAIDALEDILFPPQDSREAFAAAGNKVPESNPDPFRRDSTGQAIGYVEGDPMTTEF